MWEEGERWRGREERIRSVTVVCKRRERGSNCCSSGYNRDCFLRCLLRLRQEY